MVNIVDSWRGTRANQLIGSLAFFWLLTIALQYVSGAFESEYGGAMDEAAHYVTALMVRAFILSGGSTDPMSFAKEYYLYYPKVALGHWPPMQYGVLGLWLAVFGATRIAAMAFIALVTAATATAIFFVARREFSPTASWFAGVLFIMLPLVQSSSGKVMLESLVTFLTLLATLAFAHFVSTKRMWNGLIFAFFATIAILTRGSAWSLALLPPLTLLLSSRFDMLRTPAFWIAAIPVAALCLPWYLATIGMSKGAFVGDGFDPSFTMAAVPQFSSFTVSALGFALGIPCAVGLWVKVVRPLLGTEISCNPVWPALAAMAMVTVLMHILVPASISARYMVPVMPVAVLFCIAGANFFVQKWRHSGNYRLIEIGGFGLLAALFALETFELPAQKNGGYRASLASVSDKVGEREMVVLIASGTIGEGSIVATAAESEDAQTLILRGSKILVDEDWLGRNTKNRFPTAEQLLAILEKIPVDAVIVDTSVPMHERRAYHDLLDKALQSLPSTWGKTSTHPVFRGEVFFPQALTVYIRHASANGNSPPNIPTDKNLIRSLTGW